MPLELLDDEPLGPGLRRVMAEGVDLTIEAMGGPPGPEAVHTARKTLKVVRAALRLVGSALDGDAFAVGNRALRDAARSLSTVRDAQVVVDVLASLKKHFGDELAADAFADVAKLLARRRKAAAKSGEAPTALVAADLRLFRTRLDDWPLDDVGWPVISDGLTDGYDAGRRSMKRALSHPDDADMHEWRKRVKDHRHQLEVLTPLWPGVMPAFASAVRTLGTHLGDDHDLAVLAQLLDGDLKDSILKSDRQALSALIARRRQSLQADAARLGGRVYAERPHHFARRIHQYWKACQ